MDGAFTDASPWRLFRLGYRAFLLVLSRKPTAYGVILNHLRQLCRARETTGTKRQLQPVLSDPSNGLLRTIRF